MKPTSKIKVDFEREGKNFSAVFEVTREPNGSTYHLNARVYDENDNLIFEKERTGLDYSQVEYALTFVFHQAFVED